MTTEPNPYAPPVHDGPPPAAGAAAGSPEQAQLEALRREHLNAETNVKTIGFLLYLGAAASVLAGAIGIAVSPLISLVVLAVGVALGLGAYWLRRLDPRGRLIYTVIGGLGIVGALAEAALAEGEYQSGAAVGRMIWPVLFIAVLWSSKSSTIMTPHYRDVVIPATPHIKRKTSKLVIVALVLVLALIAVAVVGAMMS